MIHMRLLLIIILAWHFSSIDAIAQVKVGMVTRSFTDESRKNWQGTEPRPLRTAIWYPAVTTVTPEETIFGGPPEKEVFAPVTVAPGAEISRPSQKECQDTV